MKAPSMEQLYQDALNPQMYPDQRLLAVMQGRDTSIPMAVAMAAKQQRDKLMMASQGAQAQQQMQAPTVRDQMLAQAAPPPVDESGLAALPAENMQQLAEGGIALTDHFEPDDDEMQRYAAGGMVAFNTGGMPSFNDDEDDDTDDEDILFNRLIKAGGLGGFAASADMLRQKIGAVMPKSYEAALAETKQSKYATPATGGSHRDIALKAAQEKGATPWLVEHVMKKETGGHRDPARAVSPKGATGVMQLMPGTAKEMGVSDITDPHQNIYGGVGYLAKLEKKYGDPKLAAIAYNWGPGNTDKWLKRGGDMSKLPKETRNYVKNLAKGGIISFANTGSVPTPEEDEEETSILYGGSPTDKKIAEFLKSLPSKARSFLSTPSPETDIYRGKIPKTDLSASDIERLRVGKQPIGKPATAAPATTTGIQPKTISQADSDREINRMLSTSNVNKRMAKEGTLFPASPASNAPFDPNYKLPPSLVPDTYGQGPMPPGVSTQDRINDYFLNLARQQKEAQGLGLLGTGLRIAGGTSPYAMTNIGQGGAAGIQDYLTARKGLGTLEAQGLAAVAAAEKNKLYQDLYKQRGSEAQNAKYAGLLENIPKSIEAQIKNMTKIGNFDLNKPGNREKYIQQETYKRIMMNPELKRWYLESSGLTEADLQGLANPSVQVQTVPADKIRK